jgi:hypothetical protein
VKRVIRWLAAIFGIAFLVVASYVAQRYLVTRQAHVDFFTAAPGVNVDGTQFTLLILTMFTGVIAGYLYEKAKQSTTDHVDILRLLRGMPASPRFIMALVISPIVFHGVLITINAATLTLADYLLAFQNGFFWETIIRGMSRPMTQSSPATSTTPSEPAPENPN